MMAISFLKTFLGLVLLNSYVGIFCFSCKIHAKPQEISQSSANDNSSIYSTDYLICPFGHLWKSSVPWYKISHRLTKMSQAHFCSFRGSRSRIGEGRQDGSSPCGESKWGNAGRRNCRDRVDVSDRRSFFPLSVLTFGV
jgi:hypothetical protein